MRVNAERDRHAEVVGIDLAELAVGEERAADRRSADRHERHHRDQGDQGQPGRQGKIGEDGRVVAGGGIAAQPGHHHRQDRHADHPERKLQHQPGVVVDRGPGSRRSTGDLIADHQTDLADQHVEDHRRSHRPEPLEAVVDAPNGRRLIRSARIAMNSTAAWATTPRVVLMPSTSSFALPIRTGSTDNSPGTTRYSPRVAMATTLLTTGAQAGGPEDVPVGQDRHEHRRQAVENHLR